MLNRNYIQKTIATSKFTLPVVAVLSLVFWFMSDGQGETQSATSTALGMWRYIPSWSTSGWDAVGVGFLFSILAVYLMAEFNNKFILLRISSRMLSSTLAVLLTMCTFLHAFQPAHIILALTMAAYFPLFFSYQRTDSMPMIYIAFLMMSVASLFFPKFLLFTPFIWVAMIVLRAFTFRTLCASMFGIITPYWILFSLVFVYGDFNNLYAHFIGDFHLSLPDYICWSMHNWFSLALVVTMGIAGSINFHMRSHLDKTRTRTYIYVAIILFAASTLFLLWETAHFNEIFPLLIINSSILTGHHLAQEYSRFSNIYTIVVCLLIASVAYANFIGL
jgi:hypothetical protein